MDRLVFFNNPLHHQAAIRINQIENLHQVIWAKIAFWVKKFIKGFIEDLLTEEVTARIGAGRASYLPDQKLI